MNIQQQIKNLTIKVSNARQRIAQAHEDYKNCVAKLERQKAAVEYTRKQIDIVRIKIANRLAALQTLQEIAQKQPPADESKEN